MKKVVWITFAGHIIVKRFWRVPTRPVNVNNNNKKTKKKGEVAFSKRVSGKYLDLSCSKLLRWYFTTNILFSSPELEPPVLTGGALARVKVWSSLMLCNCENVSTNVNTAIKTIQA